ncbi:autoinducer binding domain-containing protein [Tabrizicola sp. J26]|uniref:autoinducer binding domain-containing protein n=1 Tax=Alitabrizicola rongguiensis TaxID=2909234 RepID=UPI001F39895C|nr:autoinducer binding domain-containing protein [Tabrizicola rongguiensis]MCF1710527.1 autoinducer binding domain-containing protein [Tabrizicola rongguiensis]
MIKSEKINHQLQRLVETCDWRFAVGLRVRFNHPTLLYQTYPAAWVEFYAQNGLLFFDPTVRWAMTHTGTITWAELEPGDTAGVFRQAREYGLAHGIAVSVGDGPMRSMGFFTHANRPITKEETAVALDVVKTLHDLTDGVPDLPAERIAALQALGDGLSQDSA